MTGAALVVPDDELAVALHHRYAPSEVVLELVLTHCRIVADIAAWSADRIDPDGTTVDRAVLRAASLLHDVGTYVFFDADGGGLNGRLYPQHAVLGAKLLQDDGVAEPVWRAVETHVLMGLSRAEIADPDTKREWPLPCRDYLPQTIEAEILCYADRFHSKRPCFNDAAGLLGRLEQTLPVQAARFAAAMDRFGVPDLGRLSAAYGHPVD